MHTTKVFGSDYSEKPKEEVMQPLFDNASWKIKNRITGIIWWLIKSLWISTSILLIIWILPTSRMYFVPKTEFQNDCETLQDKTGTNFLPQKNAKKGEQENCFQLVIKIIPHAQGLSQQKLHKEQLIWSRSSWFNQPIKIINMKSIKFPETKYINENKKVPFPIFKQSGCILIMFEHDTLHYEAYLIQRL